MSLCDHAEYCPYCHDENAYRRIAALEGVLSEIEGLLGSWWEAPRSAEDILAEAHNLLVCSTKAAVPRDAEHKDG